MNISHIMDKVAKKECGRIKCHFNWFTK